MAVLSRRARDADARRASREALIAATLELLSEGSAYADLSIEQIVRRAGLSRPTFYAYFRDKRALILELGQTLQDAVAVAADPWLADGTGSLRTTLTGVLVAFREHRHATAAIVEAATYDDDVAAFWRSFHERFMATAAARIRAEDPQVDPLRAEARAFALVWMTERAITEHLASGTIDETALLEELVGFWEHALPPTT